MHQTSSICIGLIFTASVLASMGKCQLLTTEEKTSALQFINYLRRSTVPKAADMNGLIASAGVNKIGCAIQLCNGNYLAVCEFDRQYASPPYQLGEPGTKCGNGYATYYQNGLCYGINYGKPPPVHGPFECKLSCMNYGTLRTYPICSCECPTGFYGARCEIKNTYYTSTIPNDCKAQAVQCKNGGTPTIFGTKCMCVCQPNFSGDNCEENVEQIENSIFIHFGGQQIYYSYYPVDLGFWNTTNLRSTIKEDLTNEINSYCMANIIYCCQNSTNDTSEINVTELDFQDSNNFPTNGIDGTLVAAFHYTLNDKATMQCNNTESRYLPRSVLMEAWSRTESYIKLQAAEMGLPIVRVT